MGSRLSSVSNGLPKILVKIWNVPLIDLLLDNCYQAGIDHIIIVTGHNSHIIEEYIPQKKTAKTVCLLFKMALDSLFIEGGVSTSMAPVTSTNDT